MDDLIKQYREGRIKLRKGIRLVRRRIQRSQEGSPEHDRASSDKSLLESMIRDMTEVITILESRHTYSDIRGYRGARQILTDPAELSQMEIAANKWDPDIEIYIRNEIKELYWDAIQARMELLTMKQRSTLERWIDQERSISQIAREDSVSRQAVWVRLFGDKTNRGALRILRGDDHA